MSDVAASTCIVSQLSSSWLMSGANCLLVTKSRALDFFRSLRIRMTGPRLTASSHSSRASRIRKTLPDALQMLINTFLSSSHEGISLFVTIRFSISDAWGGIGGDLARSW